MTAYGIGGLIKVQDSAIEGFGAPPTSFRGQLGQQYFDKSTTPPTEYIFNGQTWQSGGNSYATTSTPGIVTLSDDVSADQTSETLVPTAKATYDYGQSLVLAGANIASEVTQGIGYVASDAEALARQVNTPGVEAFFLTPTNLDPILASPSAIGSTTPAAGTFTALTTDGTAAVTLAGNAASSFSLTGAGVDLTLSSASGSVPISAGEAVANAIGLQASAGGIDIDGALLVSIASSRNNANALELVASAGGIDITAQGAAGEDIDIVCTAGSINITAGESAANSIVITSSIGGIDILAAAAAAGEDIDIVATGSSVNISSTEAVADSITLQSSAGGIDVDAAGQVNIASSQNAASSIVITSSVGGIDILAAGASAGEDIDIVATGSSVNIESTENAALAVYLHANGGTSETIRLRADQGTGVASVDIISDVGGITLTAGLGTADAINISTSDAAGGIDIDAGTSGFIVDTTGAISLDAAANSNLTTTGAFSMTVNSTLGQLALTSGQAAVNAVRVQASNAAGGIDIDSGTGGITVDSTAAFSIDGATASNVTVTGAGADLTLSSVGGSVLVESTEDAALAIRLHANGGTSETIQIHADQGTGVSSVGLLSDVGGITLRATGLASADAINLEAAAGGIDMDSALLMSLTSTRDNAQAILIEATAGGIDISASGAAAGEDIDIVATGSSVNITSTENAADSIVITSTVGGIDILASGAGAGEDIDIIATGSSINITATEAAANAIVLTASNAAGGIDITTGGGSVDISSSGFVTVVPATDTQASPSATSVLNVNVGAATFTGFTTAAAASQAFVITNSVVTTSSDLFVTVANEGANDAQMTITRVKRSAGAFEVTCKNNGAAALNGNVTITFWVIKA